MCDKRKKLTDFQGEVSVWTISVVDTEIVFDRHKDEKRAAAEKINRKQGLKCQENSPPDKTL